MFDSLFPSPPGTIYTFYSYKGGVGRSMALVNVGVLLALLDKRVLLIDWDLEAPGLELFFQKAAHLQGDSHFVPGIVDLLEARVNGRDLPWKECLLKAEFSGKSLDIISAGSRGADYRNRIQRLDWEVLYREHNVGNFINELRDDWRSPANYDFVLIDSRTGITDIGDICTILLPDVIVLMFVTNYQNVEGIKGVMKRAVNARKELPVDRAKLHGVPVAARDEVYNEYEKSLLWRRIFAEEFADLYREWLPREVTPADALNKLFIPYVTNWSFGERIPVLESAREIQDPTTIGAAYKRLANLLSSRLDWYSLESNVGLEELQGAQLELMHERQRALELKEKQEADLRKQAEALEAEQRARQEEQLKEFEKERQHLALEQERRLARERRRTLLVLTTFTMTIFLILSIFLLDLYRRRDPVRSLVRLGWTVETGQKGAILSFAGDPPFEQSNVFLRQLPVTKVSISNVSRASGIESWTDLERLSELRLEGSVSDLVPLERLTQLSTLVLSHSNVTDISALRNLRNLSALDLSSTRVSDVSPLRDLRSIGVLDLSGTRVFDLRPLEGMQNLSDLRLASTQVADLSPLQRITSLLHLDLSRTKIVDISPLRGLTNLSVLNLSGTKISDLMPLKLLPVLLRLDITATEAARGIRVSEPIIDLLRQKNPKLVVVF